VNKFKNILLFLNDNYSKPIGIAVILGWLVLAGYDATVNLPEIVIAIIITFIMPMLLCSLYNIFGPDRLNEDAADKWKRMDTITGITCAILSLVFFSMYFTIYQLGSEIYTYHSYVVVDEKKQEYANNNVLVQHTTTTSACKLVEHRGYAHITFPTGKNETVDLKYCKGKDDK